MSMLLSLAALAASLQATPMPVEMSHRAADRFEDILYQAMREVRRNMPEACHKVRTRFSLADDTLRQIAFTCLDKDDDRLAVEIDPDTMPVDQFQSRYLRLRDAIDDKLRDEPIDVAMTVDRRGRIHSQFLFYDFYR